MAIRDDSDSVLTSSNRRQFVAQISSAGLGLATGVLLAGCGGGNGSAHASSSGDTQILNAAATAEALATTMYYNIINAPGSIYQSGAISGNAPDKAYLVAGYEEELNHYNFLTGHGGTALATTFYFPTGMFTNPQVTVNTLVTLEDAFIAAYLIGVNTFSTNALKVIAAQIMGVESEHRALARVIANDLNLTAVSGLAGSESVAAPTATANNLAYERTFSTALPNIAAVVTALGPYTTPGTAGFSATAYPFSTASAAAPSAGQTTAVLQGTTPTG